MVSKLDRVFRKAAKNYATSFPLWLFTAPFLIAGLVFTELPDTQKPSSIGNILVAGAVSQVAMGIVLWVAGKTVLRPSRRISADWKEVVGVFAIAGAIRGLCIGAVIDFLEVGDTNFLTRVTTSVILVVFSFTVSAHSAQLWREYKDKRIQLLSSIAVGERTDILRSIASSEYRPLALGGLEQDVLKAREQTRIALHSIREKVRFEKIDAKDIQEAFEDSDTSWRDLSHKAWIAALPNIPKITFSEIARTLASSKPISLIVLSSGPLYGFTRVFENLSLAAAALGGLFWLLGILTIAISTNTFAARNRGWGITILIIGFVAIQAVAIFIGGVLLDGASAQLEVLYVSLISSLAAIALGLPPALERSGQVVLEQLEQRLNKSEIDNLKAQGEMFVLAQRIGSYLHSEVRGDFLRSSLALREALERNDPEAVERILDQLDNLVSDINLEESSSDPIENLMLFLNNWSGVIEINHNLEDIKVDVQIQRKLEAVVMEAVNNAVRHGAANQVKIALTENPNTLELQIDSNSEPLVENLIPGIGTKILDRHAPGRWSWQSIETPEASSVLRLNVSFSQQGGYEN